MHSDDVLVGVPATEPEQIAPETWLIPNLFPAGDGLFVPVNTMLIRGAEPVIVGTGARRCTGNCGWRRFSRSWSRRTSAGSSCPTTTGTTPGGLLDAMELCPQATLVTNFFSVERLALEKPALPLERMRWIDEGGTLDAADRTLRLFKPPIFDGPTTRGLFDPTTAAMWIVDSFACLTPGTLESTTPWHQWLDPAAYRRHVDDVEALGVLAVASAHGPVVTRGTIHEAFEVVRRLAGQPIIPAPGQDLLDDLITQVLAA